MGFYFDKQPSCRVIKTQTIAYTGAGTAVSNKRHAANVSAKNLDPGYRVRLD